MDNRRRFKKIYKGSNFIIAGEIVYGLTEDNVPQKYLPLEAKLHQPLSTVIDCSYGGDKDLPNGITFTTPKPIDLIKQLIRSYPKKDALVLDYFAGSGATAHAVDALNEDDGGRRSWIMIEEMASTFNIVLKKRLERVIKDKNFGVFELKTATVGDEELMKVFSRYSKDFIAAYHLLDTSCSNSREGMEIVGFDARSKRLVALCNPSGRKATRYFSKELKCLKDGIKETKAKYALLYTINDGSHGYEEPWRDNPKDILSGTSCKDLRVVEIPEQLIQEWGEVLTAMAA